MSGARVCAAVAVAAVVLSACGSSAPRPRVQAVTATTAQAGHGMKLFSAPGMAVRFDFPAGFTLRIARSSRISGNTSRASEGAVGISRFDLLIVSRFPHRPIAVTASNIARLKPQFDAAVSSVLGLHVVSKVGTLAGRPALMFPASTVSALPVRAMSRIVNVFVGDDEYELNCQYTPAHAAAIETACDEMLATLRVSG